MFNKKQCCETKTSCTPLMLFQTLWSRL